MPEAKRCDDFKVNRYVPDFVCVLAHSPGHVHKNRDGLAWKHPRIAYGCRHPANSPGGARGKTKHGCSWSTAAYKA